MAAPARKSKSSQKKAQQKKSGAVPQETNFVDPENEQALLALFNAGKLQEAAVKAQALLLLYPDNPFLYNVLGAIAAAQGRIPFALQFYQMALKSNPYYADAYNNMANAILTDNRKNHRHYSQAILWFQKALELKPTFTDVWRNLANLLSDIGRIEEAIAHYKHALQLQSTHVFTHFCFMECLERANDDAGFAEALAFARNHLGTDHFIVRLYEGIQHLRAKRYAEARSTLEQVQVDPAFLNVEMSRQSALAKTYDKLGEVDQAMAMFARANQTCAHIAPTGTADKKQYLGHIAVRQRYFTAENIARWRHLPTPERKVPVFLVGFPRSGTTLLDTILLSHPDIEVHEEEPMVREMIRTLFNAGGMDMRTLETASDETIAAARATYFTELDRISSGTKSLVIDKMPLNLVEAGIIHRIFPDARFILALRHPCDCVLSCFMQHFHLNNAMANFLTLEDSATLYHQAMQLWHTYATLLPLKVQTLKYEDLTCDVESTIRPLCDFLDIPWNEAMLRHTETAMDRGKINTPSYHQVTQPIYRDAAGRWKKYETHLQPSMHLLAPWIRHWGYEA